MYGSTRLKAQSSVYGKIEQMLLVYPGDPADVDPKHITKRYRDLFIKFGDRVTFVILGNYKDRLAPQKYQAVDLQFRQTFRELLQAADLRPDHHVIHIPAPMTQSENGRKKKIHSTFVQDPFVVMQAPDGATTLMESYRSLNRKNEYVPEQVAAATGMLIQPTDLWLEGGNILVGDDYALAGSNLLLANYDRFFKSTGIGLDDEFETGIEGIRKTPRQVLTGRFKQALGVRYLQWLGTPDKPKLSIKVDPGTHDRQPFFHLDHYLALGGMMSNGEELVMVAKIKPEYVIPPRGKPREAFAEDIDALNGMLKQTKRQLDNSGKKFPGPRFYCLEIPIGGRIEENSDGEYHFTPYSYTNCQVEWYHGIRRIFMPHYPSIAKLERKVREKIVSIGFSRLDFIDLDLEYVSRGGGSLHCVTKVLKRNPH